MCSGWIMQLNQLSISYKCHCSIGNSLKLEEMIEEVLETFMIETDAIYGSFYLNTNNDFQKLISIGKELDHTLNYTNGEETITLSDLDDDLISLTYPLNDGLLVFIYDKSIDLDFIVAIYESFRKKLNISISACLNVERIEDRNRQLKDLTKNLTQEVQRAIEENKEKEKQLFEQMKMAQMGELIGNIAHQWRQPLSIISTASSGMRLKKELNILTDPDFFHYTDSITNNVHFLSDTIDEFRDYINDSHALKEVRIQDRLAMALKLVESSYELAKIDMIEEHMEEEPIMFRLVAGKLLQVLISILNNARDVLVEKEQEYKWIKYAIYKNEYNIVITLEDNGGGIDEEIIGKIFNPYFTTKHQSQGTGIGLYTSYDIITNHLGGRLYVKNTNHGAKFFIELPTSANYSI